MATVSRGSPLPFASIRNRRGLIYVGNLADGIVRCLGQAGTFLISDGEIKVPCVSWRMTTERPETVEAGGHIVAGLDPENIVAAVTTIVSQSWRGRYELEQEFSPSTVVVNTIRSRITNFF